MMSGTDRQPRRWTATEDQTLREHVDAQQTQGGGRDWCHIALALPGRTNKDCRKRWHNSVAEGLRKGQWSKSEDHLLVQGVHRYGSQWTKVATCVLSRSADQCAKRWQQSLDPRLDRSEWREDEDRALLAAVDRLGRHWKDIQEQHLPHRSKNCVKNRYSVLARRNATQLVAYENSPAGSSSDPGTPLQIDALPVHFASTSPVQETVQLPYMQYETANAGNDSFIWPWSGVANPNISLAMNHHQPFVRRSWSTYQNQPLSTVSDQWNALQSPGGSQLDTQYFQTLDPPVYDYTYPTHQTPYLTSPMPCSTSVDHLSGCKQPSAKLPSSATPRGGYGQERQRRDSAPFGRPAHGHSH